MLNPGIVYMLASVALSAVGVVVHFHVSHLSLPLPTATTTLATLLPLAAFLNAYIYPNLLRASHACTAPNALARLAPVVLQAAQALVAAVLATLLLEAVVSSPHLDLRLDAHWDALYSRRRAGALELIQDTYDCCGFDAVTDRAYPFGADAAYCAREYGRSRSCAGPWKRAMRATAALDFAVVVAVGLLQVLGLLSMRERTAWWTALRTRRGDEADSSSRPLLPEADCETGPSSVGYGSAGDGRRERHEAGDEGRREA